MDDIFLFLAVPAVALLVVGLIYVRRNYIPSGWVIGPVIRGKNKSINLPLRPKETAGGWEIDLPSDAEIHYVTKSGRTEGGIRVVYRVTGDFYAPENPQYPAEMSLHFQRRNDDWSASPGETEFYRWWSRQSFPMTAGTHEAYVPFEMDLWTSVMGNTPSEAMFKAALQDMARAGVTFGWRGGRGHGARAIRGGTIEVLECSIG